MNEPISRLLHDAVPGFSELQFFELQFTEFVTATAGNSPDPAGSSN